MTFEQEKSEVVVASMMKAIIQRTGYRENLSGFTECGRG
jgi:hypothetical protein